MVRSPLTAAKATWALNAAECLFRLPAIASPFLGLRYSLTGGPVFGVHYMRRRFIINLVQAHKWKGSSVEANKILNEEDWSSCAAHFQMAVAILMDDFPKAASLMKSVAASGDIQKSDYRDW